MIWARLQLIMNSVYLKPHSGLYRGDSLFFKSDLRRPLPKHPFSPPPVSCCGELAFYRSIELHIILRTYQTLINK